MTYQEAIEKTKAELFCDEQPADLCENIDCWECAGYSTLEERIEANKLSIEALEKAEKYRWIPCSERLPTKYMEVLITVDRWSHIIDEWIENDVIKTYWDSQRQMFDYGSQKAINPKPMIKAWMPLPEAYKECD